MSQEFTFPKWDIHDLKCAIRGNIAGNESLFKNLPIATKEDIDDLSENMALLIMYANDVLLRLGRDPCEEVEKSLSILRGGSEDA